ncbi:hypothetical protein DMP06_08565 [Slackia equolifaciens]|uniref:Uncharacterized protein n=1 Tax=Slackia equolifaciens TaxID=498718 RepID=A0A3N0AV87_9ACTN|nr:hypothetical protein [Slackia equolifaciens]RNL38771.1 hypothetical protein DMP06_08565 [Slackia equolifaciens]
MNEIDAIEASSVKVQRVSRVLHSGFAAIYYFSTICFIFLIVAMAAWGISDLESGILVPFCMSLAKVIFEAVVALFLIGVAKSVFGSIGMGLSPFSTVIAKRLRIAALLMVIHAVFSLIISPAFMSIAGLGEAAIGVAIGSAPSEATARFIPINVGDIVLAVVLFCAALIVEYGSLLQQLSDDTL